VFLADGTAVYDLLGKQLTLIVLDGSDVSALERVADHRRIPLTVLRIEDANAASIYQRKLILVRPDQHVAWRGDSLPDDAGGMLAYAVGLPA
jgi:hypothetical protein